MIAEDHIGVNTGPMTGVDLQEAIRLIADAGFKAIEIFGADFQGSCGFPPRPGVGLWPRTCPPDRRRSLRDALSVFDRVTLHVQLYGTDITAINPGIREESRRQYLEHLELGMELGASHITYHAGSFPQSAVLGANGPERERQVRELNVSMARELVERSEGSGVLLGYENGPIRKTLDLIDAVDRDRFGLLLDVAHGAMRADWKGTDGIIDDLDLCRGKLVQVHVHGLWGDVCVLRDHQDLRKNNLLDYGRIMPKLREIGFGGPFVFEISAPNAAGVVERCADFKEHLRQCWDEPLSQ